MIAVKCNVLRLIIILFAIGLVAGFLGCRNAIKKINESVLTALGPQSEVKSIRVGLFGLSIDSLRIKGTSEWPAKDKVRLKKMVIVPSVGTLFSDKVKVKSVDIDDPYFSIIRAENGRFITKPVYNTYVSYLPRGKDILIENISAHRLSIDLFDYSIAKSPFVVHIENASSTIENITVPDLAGRIRFELAGSLAGNTTNGSTQLGGWVEIKSKSAIIDAIIDKADISSLQSYFLKPNEQGFESGLIKCTLHAEVKNGQIKAPCSIILSNLAFSSRNLQTNTIFGIPQNLIEKYIDSNKGMIDIDFSIEGNITNPSFSPTDKLYSTIARSLIVQIGKEFLKNYQNIDIEKQKELADSIWRSLNEIFR